MAWRTFATLATSFAMSLGCTALGQDATDGFGDPRLTLTGFGIRQIANNIDATAQVGEPSHNGYLAASKSLWWTWETPTNATIQIHTIGSEFDTVLAVYTGAALPSLTKIAANDDFGCCQQSLVQFAATSGTVYYVAVDSVGEGRGNIVLRFRDPAAAPVNDQFENRTDLGSSTNVSAVGTNVDAVPESGELPRASVDPFASTWWSWNAPTSCVMEVDTRGSAFDTVLGVYTGATVAALVEMASNDDHGTCEQARVWFPVVAGTTYQIAVDSANGVEGSVSLGIRPVDPPQIADLHLTNATAMWVSWDSVPGERYRVALSTNLYQWASVTTLVSSGTATSVPLVRPASLTCFSRIERYLEP